MTVMDCPIRTQFPLTAHPVHKSHDTTDRVNRFLCSPHYSAVQLFVVLASLVTNRTGCLARGLTGCLTFSASAFAHAYSICLVASKCFNTLHTKCLLAHNLLCSLKRRLNRPSQITVP